MTLKPGSIAISAWIKPRTLPTSGYRPIAHKYYTSTVGGYLLALDGARLGKIGWWVYYDKAQPAQAIFSDAVPPAGQWTHIVVMASAEIGGTLGSLEMYVNGVRQIDVKTSTIIWHTPDPFQIGIWFSHYFDGAIDELMVFDRTLTPEDIGILYRTQSWSGGHPVQKSFTKYTTTGLSNQTKVFHNGTWVTSYSEYDAYGNLVKVTGPSTPPTTYEYSGMYGSEYLTKITQPLGVQSTFAYQYGDGMRAQEVDPNGGVTDNTYDKLLRILTTTYPSVGGPRNSIAYAYDDANNVLTITDELGHKTKHYFDAVGRETRVERLYPDNSVYSYETSTYDWQDRIKTQTNAMGHVTSTTYDLLGRVTMVCRDLCRNVGYGDINNLVTATDEQGRVVRFTYDRANRLVKVEERNPASGAFNATVTAYDGLGSLVSVKDADGLTTTHVYDDMGRRVATLYSDAARTSEKFSYNSADNMVEKTKRDGSRITFRYDALNRMTLATSGNVFDFDSSNEGFAKPTDFPYSDVKWDGPNKRVYVLADRRDSGDEMFVRTTATVSQSTNFTVASRWSTTQQGNWQGADPIFLTASSNSDLNAANTIRVYYASRDSNLLQNPSYFLQYKDAGGVLRLNVEYVASRNTEYHFYIRNDAATHVLSMEIRSLNDVTLLSASYQIGTNPNDGFTVGKVGVSSDGFSNTAEPVTIAWADDILLTYGRDTSVRYSYDKTGNTKRVQNPAATLWYEYDARNRMNKESSLVDATNYTTSYSYDAASNLANMTYPDGTMFTYTSDSFNRVSSVKAGSTTYASLGYWSSDRVWVLGFGNGIQSIFDYDSIERPTRIQSIHPSLYTLRPNGPGDLTQWTMSGTGGANWDRVDETPSDGDGTYVSATTAGKVDKYNVQDVTLAPGESIYQVNVHVVARQTNSNSNAQLKVRINSKESSAFSLTTSYADHSAAWTYNPDTLQPWTQAEVNSLQVGQTLSAISTGEARVTQVWVEVLRVTLDLRYTYNGASDITQLYVGRLGALPWTETFSYDGQDRLWKWTASGGNTFSQQFSFSAAGDRTSMVEDGATWSYGYNEDHRLTSYSKTGFAASLTYDLNGNVATRMINGVPYGYEFDAQDRLTAAKQGATTLGTYSYDGLGRRVKVVEGSTTTYFTYSGQSLIQTNTGGTVTKFLYASGHLVARFVGSAVSYFHEDPLGSTRVVTDSSAATVFGTQYKPFGAEYATTGTDSKLKFTGQWRDTNTGLYYLFRRFYDPDIGRFFSQDRILGHLTAPQSLTRYSYAVNNPLKFVDPTGDDWWNPLTWGQDVAAAVNTAAAAVGDWWASSSLLDKLDVAMTIVGFIPGLDVVSDAYFLGRAIVDVVQGKGSWTDVAMTAAFMLVPVAGAAILKKAKTFLRAAEDAGDVGRIGKRAEHLAEDAKAISKADGIGEVAAKGGVYKLVDAESGQVMRTGRTNNLARRAAEHARDPALRDLEFKTIAKTDVWTEQREAEIETTGIRGRHLVRSPLARWWLWCRSSSSEGQTRGPPRVFLWAPSSRCAETIGRRKPNA